jgi:protein phosphatase-4 regulatory subunit 3
MPRDNLLNSACLELFEFIRRENIKAIVTHLVDTYRERLQTITYVDTFHSLILRYDQMMEPPTTQELENSFTSVDSDTPARNLGIANGGKWGQGLKEVDADEEAYFNGSDDEDDGLPSTGKPVMNGASPVRPLVNYPDDEGEEDEMDVLATSTPSTAAHSTSSATQTKDTPTTSPSPKSNPGTPPERISEKRRREEDEEDELIANLTSSGTKRRASVNSNPNNSTLQKLRRRTPSVNSGKDGNGPPKKISLSIPLKSGGEGGDGD